jgi:copper transport protein
MVGRKGTRWLGRVAAIAVALLMGVAAPAAQAHAVLEAANPAPGSRLASSPAQITLTFSEPLNRALSTATLAAGRSDRRLASGLAFPAPDRIVLRTARRLPAGDYQVRWHSVSALDGHALTGSFAFGVQVRAIGNAVGHQEGPLADHGWLRIGLRAVWYAGLFFFGAAVLCRTLPAQSRNRTLTRAAGWTAVAAGIGLALAETADAAGSVSWRAVNAYLLSSVTGAARPVAILAVVIALLVVARAPRLAATAVLAALGAVALTGHATAASPQALAVATNWLHLVAAVIWAGGIAQIAAWLPALRQLDPARRRRVLGSELDRFGRVALPAFAMVLAAGTANAVIEVGSFSRLADTGLGRVLIVKVALVAVIAAVSCVHAFVLRPRSRPIPARRLAGLIGAQSILVLLVLGAAAALAAVPPPAPSSPARVPRVGSEAGHEPELPARLGPPAADQLAVAEEAGPWIAAVWVTPEPGRVHGTVRLLDYRAHPVAARMTIADARTHPCGVGCLTFTAAPSRADLRVLARSGRSSGVAVVPIRWRPTGSRHARRILAAVASAMNRLRSFRIDERLTAGLGGPPDLTRYLITGRHVFKLVTTGAARFQEIAIGSRVWTREPGRAWQLQTAPPLDTRALMPWWTHVTGVRLLATGSDHGRRTADIALADIRLARVGIPFWFRLHVDLTTMRVLAMRMITVAHFMNQRYLGFNTAGRVTPP